MNGLGKWIGAAAVGLGLAHTAAAAHATADAGVFSKYVWRGLVLNDDAVAQAAVTVEDPRIGLRFETWANFDLTDAQSDEERDRKHTFTEIDLAVTYRLPLEGPIEVSLGWIEYTLPGGGASTREAMVSVSTDRLPFSPELSLYYDFEEIKGAYAVLALSEYLPFTESERFGMTLEASVGMACRDYNEAVFGVSRTRLNDGNLKAEFYFCLTDSVSLSVTAQYTALLDGGIRRAVKAEEDSKDVTVVGLNLNYLF